jgi:transcription elongation factor Elf1
MDEVELRPAWAFTCSSCGNSNFARAVVPCSLEGQLPEGFDAEAYKGVEWYTKPTRVECGHCGAEFGVEED